MALPRSRPWDEAQIVVEGEAEFRIGAGDWVRGGSGTVQLLPRGGAREPDPVYRHHLRGAEPTPARLRGCWVADRIL
jgi:hypothetical protein